jgi:hypothetical protein
MQFPKNVERNMRRGQREREKRRYLSGNGNSLPTVNAEIFPTILSAVLSS